MQATVDGTKKFERQSRIERANSVIHDSYDRQNKVQSSKGRNRSCQEDQKAFVEAREEITEAAEENTKDSDDRFSIDKVRSGSSMGNAINRMKDGTGAENGS